MRGYPWWRYCNSLTVLLERWSNPAGSAAYSCDYPTVGLVHCVQPFVVATFKQGFCHSSNAGSSRDGTNVTPKAGLTEGPIPREGGVEDDNVDKTGGSSSQLQSKYWELHKVASNAGVTQAPHHYSNNKHLQPNAGDVLSYLAGQGFTAAELEALQTKYPAVTKLDIDAQVKLVLKYFQEIGLSRSQVVKLVGKRPRVLSYSVTSKLQPLVDWLLHHGVDGSKIGSILKQCPQIVSYSIESKLQLTVEWLLHHGVDGSKIGSILEKHPSLFSYSIESKLQPTIDYLVRLGLRPENIPRMFQCSIVKLTLDNINAKCDALRHKYKLPEDFIHNVLNTQPQIICCDVLANFNAYLAAGFTEDEIRSMVMNYKMALVFNVSKGKNKFKLQFYLEVAHYKIQDIAECSRLLGSSLETIKARWESVVQQGSMRHPTPKEFRNMLKLGPCLI